MSKVMEIKECGGHPSGDAPEGFFDPKKLEPQGADPGKIDESNECAECGEEIPGVYGKCRSCGRTKSQAHVVKLVEDDRSREDRVFEIAGCFVVGADSPIATRDLMDIARASILLADEIYARLRDIKENDAE